MRRNGNKHPKLLPFFMKGNRHHDAIFAVNNKEEEISTKKTNYVIHSIQELPGRSDVRTTMIYTHTIRSMTIKEANSPLDS